MVSKRVLAALFLSQAIAAVAFAQSAVTPASAPDAAVAAPDEFGRVSGGELNVITKHSDRFSGSFGIGMSRSQMPFATGTSGSLNRYNATLGGTIVPDRAWFFASAEKSNSLFSPPFASALPQSMRADTRRIDTNMSAQIGDRQSLAASFASGQYPGVTTATLPTSFMSLHYTGVVSPNSFFSATFSRTSGAQQEIFAIPPR